MLLLVLQLVEFVSVFLIIGVFSIIQNAFYTILIKIQFKENIVR
jgi:hypothetical protein